MMGWYHSGMGWGPALGGLLFLLLATALVIAGVYFAIRLLSSLGRPGAQPHVGQPPVGKLESPEEILDRRFAAGEIDYPAMLAAASAAIAARLHGVDARLQAGLAADRLQAALGTPSP